MTENLPAVINPHDEAAMKAPVDAPELAADTPRFERTVLFEKGKANDGAWIEADREAFIDL